MFDKIITVTLNPSIDITLWLDRFVFDDPNKVEREHTDAGGKGINVSRVLTSLGVEQTALTIAGEKNSKIFLDMLRAEKVNYDVIPNIGSIRENLTVMLPDERLIKINRKGTLIPQVVMECFEERLLHSFNEGESVLVVFAGSLPEGITKESYIQLIKNVQSKGAKVAIDSALLTMEDYIDIKPFIIKPNLEELEHITNERHVTLEGIIESARPMTDAVEHLLISMGGKGMLLVKKNGYLFASAPKVEVKSTIGAGDTALAGYIFALMRRMSEEDALCFATACATASVELEGTSIISSERAETMFRRMKDAKAFGTAPTA